ncbi:unnamed protein product, partial [Dicrocoelium dendriticum]
FWIGITVGLVSQAIVCCVICSCIDWKKQVELARKRTKDVCLANPDENTVDGYNSANSIMNRYNESKFFRL